MHKFTLYFNVISAQTITCVYGFASSPPQSWRQIFVAGRFLIGTIKKRVAKFQSVPNRQAMRTIAGCCGEFFHIETKDKIGMREHPRSFSAIFSAAWVNIVHHWVCPFEAVMVAVILAASRRCLIWLSGRKRGLWFRTPTVTGAPLAGSTWVRWT